MSVLDAVKRRWDFVGRLEVEVPEWLDESGQPVVLYFAPYNGKEKGALMARGDSGAEMVVDFLIRKAQLEDGSPAFSRGDRAMLLRRGEIQIMERIVGEVVGPGAVPPELDPEG